MANRKHSGDKNLTARDDSARQRQAAGQTTARSESGMMDLQQKIGNRAVQRLLAQRSGAGSFELDDETTVRINRARGGGQPLEHNVQAQMGAAMDHDFSSVQVHTSPEADDLNKQLGAKAFTTGRDVFFRQGTYQPHTSGGQELIAHELTHVVQQSSGAVGGSGSRMTVNAPGDAFEQEADAVASEIVNGPAAVDEESTVPRQEEEEAWPEG